MNHVSHLHKHGKMHARNNFLQLNSGLGKSGFLHKHHAVSIHFIRSICMCRMRRFLAVLRSFFHSSLLYTHSFHPFPPTSLPSSLTSPCHLFLGLPLSLVVSKCIDNTFLEFCFLPFFVHAQNDIIYLTLLPRSGFFNTCLNFFIN